MPAGYITSYIDVAQLTLYAFWVFFAGLIFYLRREDKREGYPLENDRSHLVRVEGFPPLPAPKMFRLASGEIRTAPHREGPQILKARATTFEPGAPIQPVGWGMLDGVGPAAYAGRADVPDRNDEGDGPRLVPMRLATAFSIAEEDPDPRGMVAVGGDRQVAGVVVDCWVDVSEVLIRYLEVETRAPLGGGVGRRVLVPMPLVKINPQRRRAVVKSVMAAQFADAPALANPDEVTKLEEDQVSAFFGGGNIYADARRMGPVL